MKGEYFQSNGVVNDAFYQWLPRPLESLDGHFDTRWTRYQFALRQRSGYLGPTSWIEAWSGRGSSWRPRNPVNPASTPLPPCFQGITKNNKIICLHMPDTPAKEGDLQGKTTSACVGGRSP